MLQHFSGKKINIFLPFLLPSTVVGGGRGAARRGASLAKSRGASRAPARRAAGELPGQPDELPARQPWLATASGTGARTTMEASVPGQQHAPSCGSARPLWVAVTAGSRWRGRERERLRFGDEIQRLWFTT
jgi:hypothetical protein